MAVRIRLTRTGRRNRPCYRIGAFDSQTRRDGRCLENLGLYDPFVKDPKEQVRLQADRVKHWLSQGAKPTAKVRVLLKRFDIHAPSA